MSKIIKKIEPRVKTLENSILPKIKRVAVYVRVYPLVKKHK